MRVCVKDQNIMPDAMCRLTSTSFRRKPCARHRARSAFYGTTATISLFTVGDTRREKG